MNVKIDSAYIELTSNCNLRCRHCYNSSGGSKCLDEKKIKKVIDDLTKLNCEFIIFSGGEPLTYRHLFDVILYAKHNHKIRIVTNGTLVNEENIKTILSEVDEVQVSLDGTNSDENDFIRGEGNYSLTKNAIRLLTENDIKVIVHCVLIKSQFNNIDLFIKDLEDLGVEEIDFALLNYTGRANANKKELSFDYNDFKLFKQKLNAVNNNIRIKEPSLFYGNCPVLENIFNIRIDYNGNVFPCQRFKSDPLFSIGNIKQEDLKTIMLNEEIDNLINLMEISQQFIRKCKSCSYDFICEKPCPADIINKGIFDFRDKFCEKRKEFILNRES